MITYLNKKLYLFSELKDLAIAAGVNSNKVVIGLWLKEQGYTKIRLMNNYERKYYYYK